MQEFLQYTLNGLSVGSIYALIALGYTMVYGILGMINFAHSEIYMIGAFGAFYFAKYFSEPLGFNSPSILFFTLGLLVSCLVAGLVGFLIEKLAYKPLRSSPKLNVLITAIGVSMLFQFGGQIIFGADPKPFPVFIQDQALFEIAGSPIQLIDVMIYVVSFLSLGTLSYIVLKTQTGRAMRAVSHRPDITPLMGIHNDRIISTIFIIGSVLAGVASILVAMKYPKIDPMMGIKMGMSSFVAAVLGGIGSLHGAVVGAFILALSESYLIGYGASTYREGLAFVILIFILLYKPTGIFGKKMKEKI